MIDALLICLAALSTPDWSSHYHDDIERPIVCIAVALAADRHGVDPAIAVTVAHWESRYRIDPSRTSRVDGCCHGALQIHAGYHCPYGRADDCALIDRGAATLAEYVGRYRRFSDAMCAWFRGSSHVRRGTCDDEVRRRARSIRARAEDITERAGELRARLYRRMGWIDPSAFTCRVDGGPWSEYG